MVCRIHLNLLPGQEEVGQVPPPDPKEISVVNIPVPDSTSSVPSAPAPKQPNFDILRDKLAEMVGGNEHPLDTKEPEPPPTPKAKPTKPTPQPEPEQEPAPPSAAIAPLPHPQDLIDAALNLGIDERHLVPGAVSTQALLDWVVSERLRDSLAANRPIPTQNEKAAPVVDEDAEALGLLEESGTDPKIIAFLRRQNERVKKAEAVEGTVKQLNERDSARETASNNDIIDAAIEGLGADFEPFLGKGGFVDLVPGSFEHSVRMSIAGTAGIDWAKDSPRTKQRKYTERARAMLKDKVKSAPTPAAPAAPAEPSYADASAPSKASPAPTSTEEWNNAALGKPGGKPQSKQELAHRRVLHDAMREMGMDVREDAPEQFNGVPG